MYSATTRSRYASLFKTAEAKVPVKLAGALEKSVAKHPLLLAAMMAATGVGGHALGKAEQKKSDAGRTDAWTTGVAYGHRLGRTNHHDK